MADIRVTQASQEALKARLATTEGKEAVDQLARLIYRTAIKAMPPALLASLEP